MYVRWKQIGERMQETDLRDDDEAPHRKHAPLAQHVEQELAHGKCEVRLEQGRDGDGRERHGDDEDPAHPSDCCYGDEDGYGGCSGCTRHFLGDVRRRVICIHDQSPSGRCVDD